MWSWHKQLLRVLQGIERELRGIRDVLMRGLLLSPNQLIINLPPGATNMALPKTYPIGTLTSLKATEFDTLVSPPAPFAYAQGSVVYAQTGGAATLQDNGDGTFVYPNTVPEVITVTATDSVSNPGTVLSDNVLITFQVPALLPNQLNIVLP
ncbi:MAG: hypothetical protein ABSH01_19005 [Terriglobia bacterium]|jgi:hypothetical protein